MENTLVLGTFDGVHIAHRALLFQAQKTGGRVIACTFDAPPAYCFKKIDSMLSLPEEKKVLLLSAGADEVFMQHFDEEISALSPEEYIKSLVNRFSPKTIVAGFNHRFGKNAQGSGKELTELGKKFGFNVLTVPPYIQDGILVSSTGIRNALSSGDVLKANLLLGRRYAVSGVTVHGRHVGHTIGFPTVNTAYGLGKMLPEPGVYATVCTLLGKKYKGMTNIGANPTVSDSGVISVETYVLGFDGDVYGENIKLEFAERLRDEKKFDSIDSLKAQLEFDVALTDGLLKYKM